MNQARHTIDEQRSQIMLLREQEVEVNRQQAINIQRCLELSEINRNKDEEIRMLRAQLETKAKASESVGSPKARPPTNPEFPVTPSPVQNVHVLISSPTPPQGEESLFGDIGKPPGLSPLQSETVVAKPQHPGGVSKRQTSTSRSTTEAEVISLAHSLYAEGLPSLQLWERLLGRPVKLRVKEDNQATIKVVKKGFSPKLRHIQRTHKVNLGCLQEIFDEDESSVLEYVETDKQAADIFTKGLVPAKWPNALALLGIRELPEEIKTTKVAIPGLGDN